MKKPHEGLAGGLSMDASAASVPDFLWHQSVISPGVLQRKSSSTRLAQVFESEANFMLNEGYVFTIAHRLASG
jgi:hypothetical protein